jgi:hypothetical protein
MICIYMYMFTCVYIHIYTYMYDMYIHIYIRMYTYLDNKNFRDLPERRKVHARIEGIEDFCIDYTYANPTLWLIAGSGVWYRLAGGSCVGSSQGI